MKRIFIAIFLLLTVISIFSCSNNTTFSPYNTKSNLEKDNKDNIDNSKSNYIRDIVGKKRVMAGYFRTWHDKYGGASVNETPLNSIEEIPDCIDILCVFPSYTPKDSIFWSKLKDTYVPHLNKQNTQVVITIGFDMLAGKKLGTNSEELDLSNIKPNELARKIIDESVYKYNLNGVDIDYEYSSYSVLQDYEIKYALQVLREIGKLIGPRGKDKSKLLILDTDTAYLGDLLIYINEIIDFFFLQTYGLDDYNMNNLLREFYNRGIDMKKCLLGYTFYEENSTSDKKDFLFYENNNTTKPIYIEDMSLTNLEKSNAAKMANKVYPPNSENKLGGIFGYAIDRDGVKIGNNTKFIHTNYPWTNALHKMLK